LFRNKEKYRYAIVLSLAISALPNALTFAPYSLVRNFMMIIPIVMISSYGLIQFIDDISGKKRKMVVMILIFGMYSFFLISNWDIYLNHYPKRATVIRAWQCGRSEVASYIEQNYDRFDRFVITNRDGQMYMFLLFYLGYEPATYQKEKPVYVSTGNDFTTVYHFDKFYMNFKFDPLLKKTAFIGDPDDFPQKLKNKVKKINHGSETIYWIYENKD
jgi:hypothetical protein